jgi:hypothetical protein
MLRTSNLHQSIEKLSKFCTHLTETRYVLRESHGRCRDDNPTRTAKSSGFRAWTNLSLYGFISKRLCRVLKTVVCGSYSSRLARRVDFLWAAMEASPNTVHSCIRHRGPTRGTCFYKCTLSARISCTRRKWILGWVIPCEIVCEMHVAQLLQILSSLTAEHTNSSVVG